MDVVGKCINSILEFSKEMKKYGKRGMNSWSLGYLIKGDLHTYKEKHAVCYARWNKPDLLRPLPKEDVDMQYMQVPLMRPMDIGVNPELKKEFLTYLVQRSPYSNAFTVKDIDFIFKHGAILDVHVPNNLMAGAAMLLRTLWEHTYIPNGWKELCDLGVPEDMALLGAHYIKESNGRYKIVKDGGHRALRPISMPTSSVKNFLHHFIEDKHKPYHEVHSYGRVHDLWWNAEGGDLLFEKYEPEVNEKHEDRWDVWYVRYDRTMKPYARWLIKQYNTIMKKKTKPAKEAANHKENKKPLPDAARIAKGLISLLTVKNGFTLAEVRKYRKAVRTLASIEGGLRNLQIRNPTFNTNIHWAFARAHVGVEFMEVDTFCRRKGIYLRNIVKKRDYK